MVIRDHAEEFHDLPVTDFRTARTKGDLPAADATAWRVGLDWEDEDEEFADLWQAFLDGVDLSKVTALVLGRWFQEEPESLSEALPLILAAADRLPALRALFLCDVTGEGSLPRLFTWARRIGASV